MRIQQVNRLMHNALTALLLTATTSSTMAYDQGEAERKVKEMLYGKPVPDELKDPGLSPAEVQKKQIAMQRATQQEQENRELAKQNRIKFLHEISYTAFSSLKNEGVVFDNVRSRINDVVEINDSEDFAVGKELRHSFYENPSYFCPHGADCIRIDSTTDSTRKTSVQNLTQEDLNRTMEAVAANQENYQNWYYYHKEKNEYKKFEPDKWNYPHNAKQDPVPKPSNISPPVSSATVTVSECRFTIFGSNYVPGKIPGSAELGEWECNKFNGQDVKKQAIEAVRNFTVDQMRKGVSAPATELSRMMNNEAEKFFHDMFSNLPQ